MKPVLAIVGPTAVGKTELAIELAQKFNGEIVGADSRQVYRHMDIGTAKPTAAEQALVPHHLIDIVDPDEEFSLAQFQHLAMESIGRIHECGKLPILTGGSGLYVWAVLEGWGIPEVPPDPQLRQELEARAKREGGDVLYHDLSAVDPESARQIDARNVRRVIRALEVCRLSGRPFSELRKKTPPDFDTQIIGLTAERSQLYQRIDSRVDRMIEEGFASEVQGLLQRGYGLGLPAMSSLGYREIGRYLHAEMSLPDVVERIKFETHRFVRHQYAWFRLSDERIHWSDSATGSHKEAAQLVAKLCRPC